MIKRTKALIFASLLLLTGCSTDENQDISKTTIEKEQDNNDLDTEDVKYEKDYNQDKINEDNKEIIEEQLDENTENKSLNQSSKFKIYTSNESPDEIIEVVVENIDYNNSLKYNL